MPPLDTVKLQWGVSLKFNGTWLWFRSIAVIWKAWLNQIDIEGFHFQERVTHALAGFLIIWHLTGGRGNYQMWSLLNRRHCVNTWLNFIHCTQAQILRNSKLWNHTESVFNKVIVKHVQMLQCIVYERGWFIRHRTTIWTEYKHLFMQKAVWCDFLNSLTVGNSDIKDTGLASIQWQLFHCFQPWLLIACGFMIGRKKRQTNERKQRNNFVLCWYLWR